MNGINITKLTETCIVVEVPSSRGGIHKVKYNRRTNKFTYTCEDYFFRERFCKHMRTAKSFLESLGITKLSEDVVTNNNKTEADIDVMSELLNIKKQLYLLKRVSDAPEIQSSINSLNLVLKEQRNLGEI